MNNDCMCRRATETTKHSGRRECEMESPTNTMRSLKRHTQIRQVLHLNFVTDESEWECIHSLTDRVYFNIERIAFFGMRFH